MNKGYIMLHRQIMDNPLWQDKPFSKGQAWMDLIMMANYAPGDALLKGHIVHLERGQLIRSLDTLSSRWGWSVKKVRNFLYTMQTQKMVTSQGTPQGTLITIENYDLYNNQGQAQEQAKVKAEGKQRASRGQRIKKNKKNNKNKNKGNPDEIREIMSNVVPMPDDMRKKYYGGR